MTASPRTVLTLKRARLQKTVLEERLHKVLANAGLGSRRALEQRIERGEIQVNSETAEIGSSVRCGDRVVIDGRQFVVATEHGEQAAVLLYHKSEGEVTTREDPENRPTIFENLPRIKGARWIAVGRLDINTTGLLLLTTDGELAHALMHPSSNIEREYLCRVHGEVPDLMVERLHSGIELEDGPARFEDIQVISSSGSHSWFRVSLHEGRNREVRRIWESQGFMISRLKRIRYGQVELPRALRRGHSQVLDAEGIKNLRASVALSDPSPTLTLKPVLHQRRSGRHVHEIRPPSKAAQAWTGSRGDEAREFAAFDRLRDDDHRRSPGARPKRGSRSGNEINGNVAKPDRNNTSKGRKPRSFAPGQELPSVRSWFAGDSRTGKNVSGRPAGKKAGGPRNASNSRKPASKASGRRPAGTHHRGGPPR